jgi:hypothetical protein
VAADAQDFPMHPLRSQARVLLLGVLSPYAQDDQYGSRLLNPMDLYHNQVTRVQHTVRHRKNALFYKTCPSTGVGDLFMSLILFTYYFSSFSFALRSASSGVLIASG